MCAPWFVMGQHLHTLQQNTDFWQFALQQWRFRRLAGQLLVLRYPAHVLVKATLKSNI